LYRSPPEIQNPQPGSGVPGMCQDHPIYDRPGDTLFPPGKLGRGVFFHCPSVNLCGGPRLLRPHRSRNLFLMRFLAVSAPLAQRSLTLCPSPSNSFYFLLRQRDPYMSGYARGAAASVFFTRSFYGPVKTRPPFINYRSLHLCRRWQTPPRSPRPAGYGAAS